MSGGIDIQISKSEEIDLSGEDIHRITDGKARIIEYEEIENIHSIDDLLGEFGAVIILYETRKNYGHWVCLFRTGNKTLEFFDPYGLKLDQELDIAPDYNTRLHNGVLTPHLTALMELCAGCKVNSNTTQLQNNLEHTNTCGRWVALRIRFRGISLKRFIELMTNNKYYDGDWFVSALTLFV